MAGSGFQCVKGVSLISTFALFEVVIMGLESLGWVLAAEFAGNTTEQYLLALAILIGVLLALIVVKRSVIGFLKRLAAKTQNKYDDLVIGVFESIKYPVFLITGLYVALNFLAVPQIVLDGSYYLLLIALLYYAIKILQVFVDFFAKIYKQTCAGGRSCEGPSRAVDYVARFAKLSLWLVGVLVLLSNMGFDITAMVAGLGIGGIAIALALQAVLQDVFCFFSIQFDKPFEEGDFLIIGDDLGTVEKIGLRSTRIKTLQGEELIVRNEDLTNTRIHNFKKMKERRIQFGFGVEYKTPSSKLEKIPGIVEKIISGIGKARFDRAHFKNFGDFDLKYEVAYYLDSGDYNEYMDAQQKINLDLKKSFEKEGIEFAFPTYKIVK